MIGRAEGANTYYYLKDHLGSVRTMVNTSGTAVAYEDFYPFGKSMPGRSSGSTGDYKFTGHERDEEAGLTLDYMMARNYDPEIGRFLQIDPLQEFSSPYTYVGNNPLSYTDPTGMYSEELLASLDNANRNPFGYKPNYWASNNCPPCIGSESSIFPMNTNQTSNGHINPGSGSKTNNQNTAQTLPYALPFVTSTSMGGPLLGAAIISGYANLLAAKYLGEQGIVVYSAPKGGLYIPNTGEGVWYENFSVSETINNLVLEAKGGKQLKRDSGLSHLSDEEISGLARDKSLSGQERRRYQTEEKARGLRNKQKRKNN